MDPSVIKWCKWYKELERLFSWLRFGTLRSECCGKIRGFRVEPQICSLFPECGRPACPLDLFHTFSALCQAFSSSRKWQPWSTPPPPPTPYPTPKGGDTQLLLCSVLCMWLGMSLPTADSFLALEAPPTCSTILQCQISVRSSKSGRKSVGSVAHTHWCLQQAEATLPPTRTTSVLPCFVAFGGTLNEHLKAF